MSDFTFEYETKGGRIIEILAEITLGVTDNGYPSPYTLAWIIIDDVDFSIVRNKKEYPISYKTKRHNTIYNYFFKHHEEAAIESLTEDPEDYCDNSDDLH